jgi:hypothetical protein
MSPIKPSRLTLSALLMVAALAPAAITNPAAADTASPAAAGKAQRSCFYSRDVQGFHAVDDNTVDLTVGVNDVYRLTTMGSCADVDSAEGIGVKTHAGGDFICDSLDIDLIVPRIGGGTNRCPVSAMRKLTPEEAKAKKPAH